MTPSIRRTAITKKISVVNIAATQHHPFQTSLNFYTLGNASSPPSFGDCRRMRHSQLFFSIKSHVDEVRARLAARLVQTRSQIAKVA